MSKPRKHCSAIFLDGMVYVAGGVTADGQDLDIVEKYDPTTEKWDFVAHLNECKGMCIDLLLTQSRFIPNLHHICLIRLMLNQSNDICSTRADFVIQYRVSQKKTPGV